MIRVQCQLMICRGHIRISMGALKVFLQLTVVCENWHFSQILHIFFISAAISMGHKWVRRSKILSGLNLNMVWWDPVQKQEKIVFEGHRSTFWIKMPFGIGHPPPTHQLQSTCVGEGSRVPNLQTEFNYLDSFKSYGIFSDFVVPTWSPSSLCCPCRSYIIPIVPTSSPCRPHHPHHPHVVPIAPRRSPCGLHGLWSPHVVPIVSVVPTSSPLSPHCLEGPHIIPNPPDTHCTHPPTPLREWVPESVKMQ